MKFGFQDPIKIRKQHPPYYPKDGKYIYWDHKQQQYDDRSSMNINAGTHYGIGHRTPVGTEKVSGHFGSGKVIPFGKIKNPEVEEVG